MSRYDPHRHHRRSIRLKGYDYASEGAYFITLLCHKRAHLFGEIRNGIMCLSELGSVSYNEWLHTLERRPNVSLGAFVIMPNHIHAVLVIDQREEGKGVSHTPSTSAVQTGKGVSDTFLSSAADADGDAGDTPIPDGDVDGALTPDGGVCDTPLPPLRSPSRTVGAMVRGYKGAVTSAAGEMGMADPVWQRNYHEHIIRNEASFVRISDYIDNNILHWKEDGFY